mgnify:FL=1
MPFELSCCTSTLLREIDTGELHQRDIAKTYALAMKSSEKTDWAKVNEAIIKRWSMAGLKHIKAMAWSGKCWRSSEKA